MVWVDINEDILEKVQEATITDYESIGGKVTVESLKGIENLVNLTSLTIKKNNLTNVKGIENLKNLVSLNLEENCLYDTFSENNENGTLVTYNNLNLIAGLHTKNGGSLENIYLNGNSGITDFSILSKLSWKNKTGF